MGIQSVLFTLHGNKSGKLDVNSLPPLLPFVVWGSALHWCGPERRWAITGSRELRHKKCPAQNS